METRGDFFSESHWEKFLSLSLELQSGHGVGWLQLLPQSLVNNDTASYAKDIPHLFTSSSSKEHTQLGTVSCPCTSFSKIEPSGEKYQCQNHKKK